MDGWGAWPLRWLSVLVWNGSQNFCWEKRHLDWWGQCFVLSGSASGATATKYPSSSHYTKDWDKLVADIKVSFSSWFAVLPSRVQSSSIFCRNTCDCLCELDILQLHRTKRRKRSRRVTRRSTSCSSRSTPMGLTMLKEPWISHLWVFLRLPWKLLLIRRSVLCFEARFILLLESARN